MYNTKARKRELLKIKSYECEICKNNGVWNNAALSLQIDHIDGDNTNNTIENLRFLCPNCHSQTSTFTGRNAKIKNFNKPSKEEFLNLLQEHTLKQISIIKAVNLRTVYQWFTFYVKEGRDKQKPRPSGIRRFSCQEIKELRNANGSIRNLASQLNVSHSLLKDIRKYRLYKDCN